MIRALPGYAGVRARGFFAFDGVPGGLEGYVRWCRRAQAQPNILDVLVDDIAGRALPPFVADDLWVDFVRVMRGHLAVRRLDPFFAVGELPDVVALGDFRWRVRRWAEACARATVAGGDDRVQLPAFPWVSTGRWDFPQSADVHLDVVEVDTRVDDDPGAGLCTVRVLFSPLLFIFFVPFSYSFVVRDVVAAPLLPFSAAFRGSLEQEFRVEIHTRYIFVASRTCVRHSRASGHVRHFFPPLSSLLPHRETELPATRW